MNEYTERDSNYMHNHDYWCDELPTRYPDDDELASYLNAAQYDALINWLVLENTPGATRLAQESTDALLVGDLRSAKLLGEQAQALRDAEKVRVLDWLATQITGIETVPA